MPIRAAGSVLWPRSTVSMRGSEVQPTGPRRRTPSARCHHKRGHACRFSFASMTIHKRETAGKIIFSHGTSLRNSAGTGQSVIANREATAAGGIPVRDADVERVSNPSTLDASLPLPVRGTVDTGRCTMIQAFSPQSLYTSHMYPKTPSGRAVCPRHYAERPGSSEPGLSA